MRVLLVSHNYPPAHSAGTEVYTANLARALRERGHEVVVFTTEKDVARAHLSRDEREHEGVRVVELVNNLHYASFRETWDLPAVDAAFAEVLEDVRPDVVHVHHLLYLSVGVAERARAAGARVVFTLHDFWLECPRFGQRLHSDGSICHEISPPRCADCLSSFRFANSALEQRVAGWIAGVRRVTGVDLAAPARAAGDWWRGRSSAEPAAPDPELLATLEAQILEREEGLRARLIPAVDRFLSPSAFLRDALVAWGLPAQRTIHLPTGIDLAAFDAKGRAPRGERLRVGFLGSLVPVKGAHVLLEAWAGLEPGLRAAGTLEVYGPGSHDSGYAARLAELARVGGARLGGAVARERVPGLLRELDVLVVPSLWYENRPLVILEAQATRTPLLVSDLGGMAELVVEGQSGYRFPAGDVEALRALQGRWLESPAELDALYAEPSEVPTLEAQTEAILEVYGEVLDEA